MKTKIIFRKVSEMDFMTKEEMWSIYKKFYHYSCAYFLNRIEKNTHFAFFYHGEILVGFTGLRVNRVKIEGKRHTLFYFGQAVIEPEFRGKSLLRRMSIKFGLKYFGDLLFSKGYCWCDALTYKSYLFFTKSMAEAFPTHKVEMPTSVRKAINHIGELYYSDSFCSETGTVRKKTNYVNDCRANVTEYDLSDPDVRFYVNANPGYKEGHGLITLCPMSLKNFVHLVKENIRKQFRIPASPKVLKPVKNLKTAF